MKLRLKKEVKIILTIIVIVIIILVLKNIKKEEDKNIINDSIPKTFLNNIFRKDRSNKNKL